MEIEKLADKITDVFAYQFKDCELNCEKQEVRNILKQALTDAKRKNEELERAIINLLSENERLHTHCDIIKDCQSHEVHEWYHSKLSALHEWVRKQPKEISDPIFSCLANGSPSVFESSIYAQKLHSLKYALEKTEKELIKTKQALAETKKEAVRELIERYEKRQQCDKCSLRNSLLCCETEDCVINLAAKVIKKVEGI